MFCYYIQPAISLLKKIYHTDHPLFRQRAKVCHALSETKTIIQQVVFFKKKQEKIYSLLTLQIKIIRYNILKEKYSKT
jgi:hypothetical protein